MSKRQKIKKLNDKGSAIITVIVLVTFVSILATTILYAAGMNYYMKATDIKTKESFYDAELALEAIMQDLIEMSDEAAREAYLDTMIHYAVADSATREYNYQIKFFAILQQKWVEKTTNPLDPTTPLTASEVLQAIADTAYPGAVAPTITSTAAGITVNPSGTAVLSGVELVYTDANGYTTQISTDYIFMLPDMDWSVDSAKTAWDSADDATALENKEVEMTEYVKYYNWTKK